ncbi:hypothetical protein MUK42_18102 [Musa troglodytarum]|uniref:Uncharacterized protein n=1 Tax=Musa troglodytarum TaxID=320322 RepID=A0A9E7HED8_9LILI|nr:hypothetical protein MUK42_18102 [Musa troglodytarum]
MHSWSPIKYVKLGGIEFKMSFVLVFTFGLVVILSKTGVEGRRLEENPLDSSLRGVQGKESLVHADNEEAKKDINSVPGEKKVKAAADASAGDSFGATKGAENDKMVDVSTMGGKDNGPHHCSCYDRVKGRSYILDDSKVVLRMSNEKIKKNIESTGEKKGKAVLDP